MSRLVRLEKFLVQNKQGEQLQAQWVAVFKFMPDGTEKMVEAYVELETGDHLHWTVDNINFSDRRKNLKYVRVGSSSIPDGIQLGESKEQSA